MTKREIKKLYARMRKLVVAQAVSFRQDYNLPYDMLDDLIGICWVEFVRSCYSYKPERSKFTTWLCYNMRHGLLTERRYDARKWSRTIGTDLMEVEEQIEDKRHSSAFNLRFFLEELDEDARFVVWLVLDTPENLKKAMRLDNPYHSGLAVRASLRQYLFGTGWSRARVATTFKNIQVALRGWDNG